jgi:hypothetical protein
MIGLDGRRAARAGGHLALERGCVRHDLGRLPWRARCVDRFHSGLATLYGGWANLIGQPAEGCGTPISDPIPGDPEGTGVEYLPRRGPWYPRRPREPRDSPRAQRLNPRIRRKARWGRRGSYVESRGSPLGCTFRDSVYLSGRSWGSELCLALKPVVRNRFAERRGERPGGMPERETRGHALCCPWGRSTGSPTPESTCRLSAATDGALPPTERLTFPL